MPLVTGPLPGRPHLPHASPPPLALPTHHYPPRLPSALPPTMPARRARPAQVAVHSSVELAAAFHNRSVDHILLRPSSNPVAWTKLHPKEKVQQ